MIALVPIPAQRGAVARASLRVIGGCLLAARVVAQAQDPVVGPPLAQAWQVDAAASHVTFHVASTLHDVDGSAVVEQGALDLRPGHATGSIRVPVRTMQTGNSHRDRTMQQDCLGIAANPSIVFQATTVARAPVPAHPSAGGGPPSGVALEVRGAWTMHGVTVPMAIPVTLAPTPSDPAVAHLTATVGIDLRRWRITTPRLAFGAITVDPQVQVQLDLVLRAAPPHAGAAPTPAAATASATASGAAIRP